MKQAIMIILTNSLSAQQILVNSEQDLNSEKWEKDMTIFWQKYWLHIIGSTLFVILIVIVTIMLCKNKQKEKPNVVQI